jgi:dCTP deaminase
MYNFQIMSIVVKNEIIDSIKTGDLVFKPALDQLQFRPHAVDLRLGYQFRVPTRAFNTTASKEGRTATTLDHLALSNGQFTYYDEIKLKPGQYFDILPGESILGFTMEELKIKSNTLMGILYPRSSVNRRGLSVDLTGIVDTGYNGHLMIPLHNISMQVIRLYPGERICQIVFERLEQPVREGYQGRYHGSLSYKPEASSRETELIRAGKIKDIKKEFKLS